MHDNISSGAFPVDRNAAIGMSKGRDTEHVDAEWTNHWQQCPPILDLRSPAMRDHVVPPDWRDLTGRTTGRLAVLGVLDQAPLRRLDRWVVRCLCGRFETRTSKVVRMVRTDGTEDCCQACRRFDYIRKGMPWTPKGSSGLPQAVARDPSVPSPASNAAAAGFLRQAPLTAEEVGRLVRATTPSPSKEPVKQWDRGFVPPPRLPVHVTWDGEAPLPARLHPEAAAFESIGFGLSKIDADGTRARLPEGWRWRARGARTPEPEEAVDALGRQRVRVRATGGGVGRVAFLLCRFNVLTVGAGEHVEVRLAKGRRVAVVMDADVPLRFSDEFADDDAMGWKSATTRLMDWLDQERPRHRDPHSYWQEDVRAPVPAPGPARSVAAVHVSAAATGRILPAVNPASRPRAAPPAIAPTVARGGAAPTSKGAPRPRATPVPSPSPKRPAPSAATAAVPTPAPSIPVLTREVARPSPVPVVTARVEGPTVILRPSADAFAHLGFGLVERGQGHVVAAIPRGWSRGAHEGELIDAKGRVRVQRRDVSLADGTMATVDTLQCRYVTGPIDVGTPAGAMIDLGLGRRRMGVFDAGTLVGTSEEFAVDDIAREAEEAGRLRWWLEERHPDHRDPCAYWSEGLALPGL